MEAPRQAEMILKHGSKSSTYKFALLKALIDYVIENPTEEAQNGFHYIPGIYLAKRFLRYYWPLWRHGIPQNPDGRTAMVTYFETFENDFQSLNEGYSLEDPKSVFNILEQIDTRKDLPTLYIKLLQDIRQTVIKMPVKHVRNVRGDVAQLFTVSHRDLPLVESDFEDVISEGKNYITRSDSVNNYLELELQEPFHVLIASRVYDELAELRFWIDSIVTKHWSEECQKYTDDFQYGSFFSSLSRDLADREPLDPYREFYKENNFPDFYYGGALSSRFDIDHFLPWSRLPVNRFWNLVPTKAKMNREKSDRLVELNDEIRENHIREHLSRCLEANGELVEQDLKATYQKYYKQDEPPDDKDQKVEELRQLVLNLYNDLDQLMVEDKYELKHSA
jgi:hypothetical protein